MSQIVVCTPRHWFEEWQTTSTPASDISVIVKKLCDAGLTLDSVTKVYSKEQQQPAWYNDLPLDESMALHLYFYHLNESQKKEYQALFPATTLPFDFDGLIALHEDGAYENWVCSTSSYLRSLELAKSNLANFRSIVPRDDLEEDLGHDGSQLDLHGVIDVYIEAAEISLKRFEPVYFST